MLLATTCVAVLPAVSAAPAEFVGTLEEGLDRPGGEYKSFRLEQPGYQQCRDACAEETRCQAYTYVKPGVQGPQAQCYLKKIVPAALERSCCTSGVKVDALSVLTTEVSSDRPGQDYKFFEMSVAEPDLCSAACGSDLACQAYAYVKPGVLGTKARCYLKQSVPAKRSNACCTSGIRLAASARATQEAGSDRPGNDYVSFELTHADPQICQAACGMDPRCQVYTYVKPRIQGPAARCYLKDRLTAKVTHACCVSGVAKQGKPMHPSPQGKPVVTYLGTFPSHRQNGWSEGLQGVANDDHHWFFTQKKVLWKFPVSHDLNTKVTQAEPAKNIFRTTMPQDLKGYDHFGDLDHYRGYLFVPTENEDSNWDARIAVFRAHDLSYVGSQRIEAEGKWLKKSGWRAVHPKTGLLYTSVGYIDGGSNPMFIYEIDLQRLKQGEVKLRYARKMYLIGHDGKRMGLKGYMQGGVFSSEGDYLYLVNGKAKDFDEGDGGKPRHNILYASGS